MTFAFDMKIIPLVGNTIFFISQNNVFESASRRLVITIDNRKLDGRPRKQRMEKDEDDGWMVVNISITESKLSIVLRL